MKEEIYEGEVEGSVSEENLPSAEHRVYNYIFQNHPFADNFFTSQELWNMFSKKEYMRDVSPNAVAYILKDLAADGYLTYDEEKNRYCERPQSEPSKDTIAKYGKA